MKPLDPSRRGWTRRRFVAGSLAAIAAPLALVGFEARARAVLAAAPSKAPSGKIDVRDKGAKGDGKSDDTSAFQQAIDALPAAGGTVVVPAGNYRIDATRAINLRSGVRLEMDPAAQLTALPNGLKRYHVIKVWRANDVEIVGGRIVGERDEHTGSGGEWGYGINIQASQRVKVSGTHISDCWGDGMWIGALGHGPGAVVSTDVTLDGVVCTNNRRQGLSIGPCQRVRILNSTFSHSNGTAPQAGIDLEPQKQGPTRDVLIQGCQIVDNQGTGLECHRNVSGLVVRQCTIRGNRGYGVLGVHTSDLWLDNNVIADNGLAGVAIGRQTHDVRITGNTLSSNSNRQFHQLLKAMTSPKRGKHAGQLRIDPSASGVTVSANTFSS